MTCCHGGLRRNYGQKRDGYTHRARSRHVDLSVALGKKDCVGQRATVSRKVTL